MTNSELLEIVEDEIKESFKRIEYEFHSRSGNKTDEKDFLYLKDETFIRFKSCCNDSISSFSRNVLSSLKEYEKEVKNQDDTGLSYMKTCIKLLINMLGDEINNAINENFSPRILGKPKIKNEG